MDNIKFIKLMALLVFGFMLLAITKAKGNTITQQPTKSEFEICMDSTNGDYTDWSCEWCMYLTTNELRTIDCIDTVYEHNIKYYRVDFIDGSGLDFVTRFELDMVVKHSTQ